MGKMVRKSWDEVMNTPLSAEQKARLEALAKRPDSEIDFSDIPPTPDSFWKSGVRNPFFSMTPEQRREFYRPRKASTTVRLDADVLAWLRGQGKGYQTRINAILRREMLLSLQAAPSAVLQAP